MTVEELRRALADLPSDARVWIEAIPDYPPRG